MTDENALDRRETAREAGPTRDAPAGGPGPVAAGSAPPLVLLAVAPASPAGAGPGRARVLAGWAMAAPTPGALVTQVYEITHTREVSPEAVGLATLDPAMWHVVSGDAAEHGDGRLTTAGGGAWPDVHYHDAAPGSPCGCDTPGTYAPPGQGLAFIPCPEHAPDYQAACPACTVEAAPEALDAADAELLRVISRRPRPPGPYAWTAPGRDGDPNRWQGASGPMQLDGAQAAVTGAWAVHAAAQDLNTAVRHGNGTPKTGDELTSAVAGWLRGHGIDLDEPAAAWKQALAGVAAPGELAAIPDDLDSPGGVEVDAARLSEFTLLHGPGDGSVLELVHAPCRMVLGPLECGDDLHLLTEHALIHMGGCAGDPGPDDVPDAAIAAGQWLDYDAARGALMTGPWWGPGVQDREVVTALLEASRRSTLPVTDSRRAAGVTVQCDPGCGDRWQVTWKDERGGVRSCWKCGCTDQDGCLEGCWWVSGNLCSSCALEIAAEVTAAGLAALPGADKAMEAGEPVPPPGDLAGRARWMARWALTVQAPLIEAMPPVTFCGTPGGRITIELAGLTLLRLASPGLGYSVSPVMAAGDAGSPTTALAYALLTAALGTDATCPACAGTGRITCSADLAELPCEACAGDGISLSLSLATTFRDQVIAALDWNAEWALHRRQVLDWIITASDDDALKALAMRQRWPYADDAPGERR